MLQEKQIQMFVYISFDNSHEFINIFSFILFFFLINFSALLPSIKGVM